MTVRFHRPQAAKKEEASRDGEETKEPVKKGPKPTDWRWGPAQFWYDMLELPEDCADYDYGLRVIGAEEQQQMDSAVAGIPSDIGASTVRPSSPLAGLT